MNYLAWRLSQVVNLPVIESDTRQLPLGVRDGAPINGVAIDTSGPAVFEALARLGLRLERPTEN
jgi:hypothetical protein